MPSFKSKEEARKWEPDHPKELKGQIDFLRNRVYHLLCTNSLLEKKLEEAEEKIRKLIDE